MDIKKCGKNFLAPRPNDLPLCTDVFSGLGSFNGDVRLNSWQVTVYLFGAQLKPLWKTDPRTISDSVDKLGLIASLVGSFLSFHRCFFYFGQPEKQGSSKILGKSLCN